MAADFPATYANSADDGKCSDQAPTLAMVDYEYLGRFLNKDSQVFALGEPIAHDTAAFGTRQFVPMVTLRTAPALSNLTIGEDAICYNPGISTQIDGLAHIGFNGTFQSGRKTIADIYVTGESFSNLQHNFHDPTVDGGFQPPLMGPLGEDVNITYLRDLGIDTVPPMVSRAIVLDMLTYKRKSNPKLVYTDNKGKEMLLAGTPITGDDVKGCLAGYSRDLGYTLDIVEGDAVFAYTGWQHVQFDDAKVFLDGEPGFDLSAAKYLAGKKVYAVGADTWGTEQLLPADPTSRQNLEDAGINVTGCANSGCEPIVHPGGVTSQVYPVHQYLLFEKSIFNFENLDLAAICEAGIREGLFALGAPKSPTPQAHINPIFIGSTSLDTAPPAGVPTPTSNTMQPQINAKFSKQAPALGMVDYKYLSKFLTDKSKVYSFGEPIGHTTSAYGTRQ